MAKNYQMCDVVADTVLINTQTILVYEQPINGIIVYNDDPWLRTSNGFSNLHPSLDNQEIS